MICALVNFFFFFALNFISLLSSAPELTAEAVALETTELTLLDPGLISSNLSKIDGKMTFVSDAAISHMPLLGAERADEFFVMGDHDHAALVVANGNGQTTQGVTVQEVGRFVQDKKMRVVPHGTGQHNLDFLSTGETGDFVVVGDFGIEANILKVLGDDFGLEDTVTETFARSFVIVEFLDELREAPFQKCLAGDMAVELGLVMIDAT